MSILLRVLSFLLGWSLAGFIAMFCLSLFMDEGVIIGIVISILFGALSYWVMVKSWRKSKTYNDKEKKKGKPRATYSFDYIDTKGKKISVKALSSKTTEKEGYLYLHGTCLTSNASRTYPVSKISNLINLNTDEKIEDPIAYFDKIAIKQPTSDELLAEFKDAFSDDEQPKRHSTADIQPASQYSFNYIDSKGDHSSRKVKFNSVDINDNNGNVYLKGVCLDRHAARTFKADSMNSLVNLDTGECIDDPLEYFEAIYES